MSEKDILREMLQNTLKNETSPVRPELWQGVQAKMAAAGVASTASTIAVKGFSALTKWLAGSAAVATLSVGTYFMLPKEETKKIFSQKPVIVNSKEEQKEVLPVVAETKIKKEDFNWLGKFNLKNFQVLCGIPTCAGCYGESNSIVIIDSINNEQNTEYGFIGNSKPNFEDDVIKEESTIKTNLLIFEETTTPVASVLESKVTEFPNVFTPNGDGQNDTYFVKAQNINAFEMKIFNSLNQVVFVTNNSEDSWNGQFNNENVPVGMYFVLVTGKDASGKSISDKQLIEVRR